MSGATEPPLTADRSRDLRRWVKVPSVQCMHAQASRGMIRDAAGHVEPGQAVILGAGRCQEIPLVELAHRFRRVTLIDHDEASLRDAMAAAQLGVEQAAKMELRVADLTGVIGLFLRRVAGALDRMGHGLAPTAAEGLASLAQTTQPMVFNTGQKSDLVIASCVLCQLHVAACN